MCRRDAPSPTSIPKFAVLKGVSLNLCHFCLVDLRGAFHDGALFSFISVICSGRRIGHQTHMKNEAVNPIQDAKKATTTVLLALLLVYHMATIGMLFPFFLISGNSAFV